MSSIAKASIMPDANPTVAPLNWGRWGGVKVRPPPAAFTGIRTVRVLPAEASVDAGEGRGFGPGMDRRKENERGEAEWMWSERNVFAKWKVAACRYGRERAASAPGAAASSATTAQRRKRWKEVFAPSVRRLSALFYPAAERRLGPGTGPLEGAVQAVEKSWLFAGMDQGGRNC